ncbi:MAG TPA: hypothetical protein PLQ35_00735 [bacterium]|nr:hypothetical protein [bacterium]HQL60796.1 hypothetical protein [bacterium]
MKHQGLTCPAILAGLFFLPTAYAVDRLPIDFPNGGFEETTEQVSSDGTQTAIYPARWSVTNGFTHDGAYGDINAIIELDPTNVRPGSPGKQSLHIKHPPSRFPTRYQSHLASSATSEIELTGMTFDAEVWVKTQDWWGSNSHYFHIWLMPIDYDGIVFDNMQSLSPWAIHLGPASDRWNELLNEPVQARMVANTIWGTTPWTKYRLENIPIEDPGVYGFFIQMTAWYNNTDNGQRTDQPEFELTGDCHVWIDDLKLVIPSGSDQQDVSGWMLH